MEDLFLLGINWKIKNWLYIRVKPIHLYFSIQKYYEKVFLFPECIPEQDTLLVNSIIIAL